ncbi:hypothetical protein [Luteococcus sp. OSA5]|uniref:hypothetical protein n=1 Tax=Luteococcus sp. OSA5 TaxID=3401630 RepID=UPI003B42A316
MSGYFSMGNDLRDHWFKIGRTEVGSTLFVVGAVIISWLVAAGAPAWPAMAAFSPDAILGGQFWRLFTWPLANGISLWSALYLFFFWIFGTELESGLGKKRMATLLVGVWAALTIASLLVGLALGSGTLLAGFGMIQFIILLLWIAEYPNRPFFFNIPAWVIGAVLVAVQLLSMIGARDLVGLLGMLLAFALVAVLARRLGLLRDQKWIPGARASRPTRPSKVQKAQAKQREQRAKDDARLNALLDQISERGMDSLTPAQRRELMKLRNRR